VAVLFGNEAHGLDRALRDRCDTVVRIPMREGAESLNLAAAVAVILFEAARRRRTGPETPRT
jgi:TrmH family RNA methyltransferase